MGHLLGLNIELHLTKLEPTEKKVFFFVTDCPPQLEVFLSEPGKVIHSGNLKLQTTITFDLKVLRRRLKVR